MCKKCGTFPIYAIHLTSMGYLMHRCPGCGWYVNSGFSLLQLRLVAEQKGKEYARDEMS